MRNIFLIACFTLLVFGQASALLPNEIGIFADAGGIETQKQSETEMSFPIYLVANIGDASGLRAFEARVTCSYNVTITDWEWDVTGSNIATNIIPEDPGWNLEKNFAMAYPNAMAAGIRVLASANCTLVRDQQGFVYIHPGIYDTCADVPLYYHPGELSRVADQIPFTTAVASYDDAVFTINNCTPPGEWTEFDVIGDPPEPRNGYIMAFNKHDDTGLMFGGTLGAVGDEIYDETFQWVNSEWKKYDNADLPVRPSPRRSSGMAYDSQRNKYVLFGGVDDRGFPAGLLDDTWEWDCATETWEEITAAYPAPMERAYMAFAYDSDRGVCVVYGGAAPTGRFDCSWEYDCDTQSWSEICDGCTPGSLSYSGMAYDEEEEMMVMFGGEAPSSVYMGETHTYDGVNWVQVITPGPSARIFPALAYHEGCGGVYLHGGRSAPTTYEEDSWVFQDGTWSEVTTKKALGPGPRSGHTMVYDTDHSGFMFFGGENETGVLNDTWFHGTLPAYESPVDPDDNVPVFNSIHTNFPNPFNPQTTIHFKMKHDGPVKLTVYDLHGRPVKTLVNEVREAGEYDAVWYGDDLSGARVASGVYTYRLTMGTDVYVGKMAVLK